MAVGSKSFLQDFPAQPEVAPAKTSSHPHSAFGISPLPQVVIGYALLLTSLWTFLGTSRLWVILCAAVLLSLTWSARYSPTELGLQIPAAKGTFWILLLGLLAAGLILAVAVVLGQNLPANGDWPPARDLWQYSIWAMVQEFILQSFFYVRLEAVLGAESAVFATALLFSMAHLPNPVLTLGTLLGGLFFCEMFRRYRSIYPIGIVHAALGLALAESMPDRWMHHMRVGIGYLHFHLH